MSFSNSQNNHMSQDTHENKPYKEDIISYEDRLALIEKTNILLSTHCPNKYLSDLDALFKKPKKKEKNTSEEIIPKRSEFSTNNESVINIELRKDNSIKINHTMKSISKERVSLKNKQSLNLLFNIELLNKFCDPLYIKDVYKSIDIIKNKKI